MGSLRNFVWLLAISMLTGCTRGGPELIPVRGTLTLDGRPAAVKEVTFSPEPGTPGSGAIGRTHEDGTFEMIALIGGATRIMKGAIPGKYRVLIGYPELFDAEGMPQRLPAAAMATPIPAIYTNFDLTPLRIEVTKGIADVTFDMKSK